MRLSCVVAMTLSILGCTQAVRSEIIPASRRITWTPGIPGGIPEPPVTLSVKDYGAVADSVTDDYGAFRRAIAALPAAGGVVLIPAGTYRIDSSIVIGSSVVLRGEGSQRTRLRFGITDASPCVSIITYGRGDWVNVVSGYTKGSTQLQVADGSSFTAGTFAEIQQANDSAVMYTDSAWKQSWSENSVGQVLIVQSVAGNTLILVEPLYLDYKASLNPQIRTQRFVERAGVERLFITRTVSTADGATIAVKNAAYCWVHEVESDHTRKAHVTCETVYGSVFRDSYFHHSYDYGGDGHGYGVTLGLHTTGCLTENNIFRHLRHAMMVQLGACGNVFGYNYSLENVQGTGETNLNQGWTPCDISLHGHYPNYNLFEGNIVQEIDVADYWGPCGPGNTFLRNVVESEGLDVLDQTHKQNIVGNVIGRGTYGILTEAGVDSTLAHGNLVRGALQWDPAIADHVVPVSYYLTAKPGFYGDMAWPSTGSEITSGTNPARERYLSGQYVAGVGRSRAPSLPGIGRMAPAAWYTLSGRSAAQPDLPDRRAGGLLLNRRTGASTRVLLLVR